MDSTAFLGIFIGYIAFTLLLGWYVSKNRRTGDDFLIGSRQLPFMLTLGTTVATLVGTGSSMGAVGFGYENGWAAALYGVGGATGLILCAWWFAPARDKQFMTMSEELSHYVDEHPVVKNVVACLILVASIGWLGAHILGGAMYLSWITDIDIQSAKVLIALGFTLYILVGGYIAVVWADSLQAIVLFTGFVLLAFFAVHEAGGFSAMLAAQPQENTSFLAHQKIGWLPALSLAIVIGVGVLATPSFRQRIYSAKSVSSARKSFVSAGILYFLFTTIPAIVGMSAFALNPELDNRDFAFPFLASSTLPLLIGLLVLIAGLSATMSSASSDAIAGVATVMRDISVMLTGKVPQEAKTVWYSRLATLLIVGVALLLASLSDDIIGYITKMIATVLSGLFVCGVLGRFWPAFNWQGALASLATASGISLLVVSQDEWMATLGNPIMPSVAGSLLAGYIVTRLTSLVPKSAL
ncbi:sodium:solute symporter family protein [Alteromonas sediminis]|uniref:Sodium:solute symporter family protein n=1 Tax=Alteromonas sediminis TaxID=2259342 RepID=A0A3N5Y2N5_9ALTE|nr:sodium:solute symporter family protein [Alteromonas sediminis]RPJ68022.1 sodium:solute symporter family protein [Alteromonas sediminis]